MNELLALRIAGLGTVLLHFLWQGALIGLLSWLTLLLLRREQPQARYAVACLALLSCLLLPAWQIARLFLANEAAVATLTGASVGPADRNQAAAALPAAPPFLAVAVLPAPPDPLLRSIVLLWALGAGLLATRLACGLFWVRRLRTSATTANTERWQAAVDRLARRFGLRRAVAVRLIAEGPLGWKAEIVPDRVPSIELGKETDVELRVSPPDDVSVGDYEVRIRTESYAYNRRVPSEDKNYRINVKPGSNLVGTFLLILALCALVVGAVLFTIKLTRR